MTLNELVISYKTKKDSQTLNKIFGLLSRTIHDKSKFVFFQQKFRAKKFVFKLVDTKKVEIEDVEQELNLFILELINKCDIDRPFDKYLFASLWFWKPNFVDLSFINSLRNISDISKDIEGNEISILDNLATVPKVMDSINLDDLFTDLTDQERKILNILKDNEKMTQSELALKFNISQARINQILSGIKLKYRGNK